MDLAWKVFIFCGRAVICVRFYRSFAGARKTIISTVLAVQAVQEIKGSPFRSSQAKTGKLEKRSSSFPALKFPVKTNKLLILENLKVPTEAAVHFNEEILKAEIESLSSVEVQRKDFLSNH